MQDCSNFSALSYCSPALNYWYFKKYSETKYSLILSTFSNNNKQSVLPLVHKSHLSARLYVVTCHIDIAIQIASQSKPSCMHGRHTGIGIMHAACLETYAFEIRKIMNAEIVRSDNKNSDSPVWFTWAWWGSPRNPRDITDLKDVILFQGPSKGWQLGKERLRNWVNTTKYM